MEQKKIVTFGEIMLRLSPPGYGRFLQAQTLQALVGGGEANVAVSLARFGRRSTFVTKVPKHDIGEIVVNQLRQYGVDTSQIARGGNRMGIYYCERGASQRPTKVIYDRSHSSIAEARREEFDWKTILQDAEWFHVTGITPALSDGCAAITLDAVKTARDLHVPVSVDLNYRKNLWTPQKACAVMSEIVPYCDTVIGNEEDAEKVFGIKADNTHVSRGELHQEGYRKVAQELFNRFKPKNVAITLRESFSASTNGWSAMLYDGKDYHDSRKYQIHIVDRVGGGDAFSAGLIHGLTSGMQLQDSLEFAVAASCLKHTIDGDLNLVSRSEVETLLGGDGSGRVQR